MAESYTIKRPEVIVKELSLSSKPVGVNVLKEEGTTVIVEFIPPLETQRKVVIDSGLFSEWIDSKVVVPK